MTNSKLALELFLVSILPVYLSVWYIHLSPFEKVNILHFSDFKDIPILYEKMTKVHSVNAATSSSIVFIEKKF